MSGLSYKNYQQVINLKTPKCKTVTKPQVATKKRTKTGCLTCRKRKKKCDEDVVDGKCQGCTRNFLECCWSDKSSSPAPSAEASIKPSPVVIATPLTPSPSPIEVEISLKSKQEPKTPVIKAAYPSPEMSPVFESKTETSDISSLVLPKSQFKVTKPKREFKKPIQAKFVNTSVEKRRLVHLH